MWIAAAAASQGPNEALIYAVGTFLGVVVTTLGLIAVQSMKFRADRTTPSPPPPVGDDTRLVERVAVAEHRLDDSDERDDMQDRALRQYDARIEALERQQDRTDPGWRS